MSSVEKYLKLRHRYMNVADTGDLENLNEIIDELERLWNLLTNEEKNEVENRLKRI